ncbi:rhamnan synthesis F family protein [Nocardioides litoris]|uniref:rhamnan synthesis F family protein n=1 Tax=Nocardioides litoris TaxID=1926648 RepID=UPI00111F7D8F|nr:rhamnan synthesis F family protein [Nocardioides litoris]
MRVPVPACEDVVPPDVRADFVRRSGWFDADWYAARAGLADGDDPMDHWLAHGVGAGEPPGPVIADLEDRSTTARSVGQLEQAPPAADDPQLLRDVELVRASGAFDRDLYLAQAGDVGDEDPVAHFCRVGWRRLHRPCRGFDTWWYWCTRLDPAVELVNPFVHHLVLGRPAGFPGRPVELAEGSGWELPQDRPVRRVCLFAGFDAQGVVDDTVVHYVRELSRFADVYYLCDGYLPQRELAKLDGITRGAWAVRHGCYDFGSYAMLAQELVGWDVVRSYDELLLVNDSCYLLRPLDAVFERMDARACDWWGLQATKGLAATVDAPSNQFRRPLPLDDVRRHELARWEDDDVYDFHVGSYFLAYRRPVLDDDGFVRLLSSVHRQRGKAAIIHKYEIGLTHTLLAGGHPFDTWLPAVHPFHPLFTEEYFTLLEQGFPLLKRYFLYQNHYDVPGLRHWRDRVGAVAAEADLDPVEAHLLRTAPHDKLTRSFAITEDRPADRRPDRAAVRDLDRDTPLFDHWWAFPVDPETDDLPPTTRAVFEAVAADPTVHKVLLTRGRRLGLEGERVTEVPLASEEGLQHVVRCGQVFVTQHPHRTLGYRLLLNRRSVHVLGDHPHLLPWSALRPLPPGADTRPPEPTSWTYLAVSSMDHVAVTAAHRASRYADVWRVGAPARDLLVRDEAALPADVRRGERELRERLAGRPLLLVCPVGPALDAPPGPETVEVLRSWSEGAGWAVGIREARTDLSRVWSRATEPWALDLSPHVAPTTEAVLRAADAVLTDAHGVAVTMATLGRRVVSLLPDLDPPVEPIHDLDRVFPGRVCRDATGLRTALDELTRPEEALDEMTRARLARARAAWTEVPDGRAGDRVARRARRAVLAAVDGGSPS